MISPALMLAATMLASAAEPAEPAPREFVRSPRWQYRAVRPDYEFSYPWEARISRRSGGAVIVCMLRRDGSLADCEVEREWPKGAGFGQAAVMMRSRYRLDPRYRETSAGKWVRLRMSWYPPSQGRGGQMPREVSRTPGPATR